MYQVWGTPRRREKGLAIKKKTPESSVGEMSRKTATNGRLWEGMDGGCPEDAAGQLRAAQGCSFQCALKKGNSPSSRDKRRAFQGKRTAWPGWRDED